MTRNILLLTFSLTLALLFSEFLVRRYAQRPREFVATASQKSVAGTPGGWLYVNTPSGRRVRPNVDGWVMASDIGKQNIHIRTNAFSLRGPEIDWAKHPRILFLGDSITLAEYLSEEDSFIGLMRIFSKRDGQEWETLNAGVSSIGIGTEYAILGEVGPRVKPDLIVEDLYLNDADSSPAIESIRIPSLLHSSWLAHYLFEAFSVLSYLASEHDASTPHGKVWASWRTELQQRYPARNGDYRTEPAAFHALMQDAYRDWGAAWVPDARALMLKKLEEMKWLSQRLNARLLVVIHPVRYQVETQYEIDEPQRQLKAAIERLGLPVHDLLPDLRAAFQKAGSPVQDPLFYDHCHHSPVGARVVAEALYPFLKRHAEAKAALGR